MSALAIAPVRERTKPERGWRGWRGPTEQKPFPSLGWLWLNWTYAFLPSPADERQPLVYTDEQARRVIRWGELDPETGEFLNLRMILEEAKGWGKSPFAGSLDVLDFSGPVCFDGWDADGEPVGVPWGTNGRPTPWVQIAAVSEDQTENTYGAMYSMLAANNGRAADDLRIDLGRTRLFLRDRPGRLEPVTASAGSREGQRLTKFTADETQLWRPDNGGVKLIRTLRRNVAKMGGRGVETCNAPTLGEKSVAEQSNSDSPDPGVLHYARRPKVEPDPSWPDERLRAELVRVYDDAYWIDPDRLIHEIRAPSTPWEDALRFWFNIRTSGEGRAIDPRRWDELAQPRDVPTGTQIGVGFDGSISRDATVLRACTADGYSFLIQAWVRPTGAALDRWLVAHPGEQDWRVDRSEVNQVVADTFARYRVALMLCDPPKWDTEIDDWAERFGKLIVLKFDTNVPSRFGPATDRWMTGIREGTHLHDGDLLTTAHVKSAHKRKVRASAEESDNRTRYVLIKGDEGFRIDAAVADVLAYEAAMTMPTLFTARKPRTIVGFR